MGRINEDTSSPLNRYLFASRLAILCLSVPYVYRDNRCYLLLYAILLLLSFKYFYKLINARMEIFLAVAMCLTNPNEKKPLIFVSVLKQDFWYISNIRKAVRVIALIKTIIDQRFSCPPSTHSVLNKQG